MSHSSYQPKSNTPGLYDGSSEARAIVQNAMEQVEKGTGEYAILYNVLDYLKGKDMGGTSITAVFFDLKNVSGLSLATRLKMGRSTGTYTDAELPEETDESTAGA